MNRECFELRHYDGVLNRECFELRHYDGVLNGECFEHFTVGTFPSSSGKN